VVEIIDPALAMPSRLKSPHYGNKESAAKDPPKMMGASIRDWRIISVEGHRTSSFDDSSMLRLRLVMPMLPFPIGNKKKRMPKPVFNVMICRFAAMRRFLRLAGGAAAKGPG
jgi:hypothetical protein